MGELGARSAIAFVRSVAVLALDADAQAAWLRTLGTFPAADELALEFDDGFPLVPAFIERGWLSETALPALVPLDEQLTAMSGGDRLWHAEALAVQPEWDRVRALAGAALLRLL